MLILSTFDDSFCCRVVSCDSGENKDDTVNTTDAAVSEDTTVGTEATSDTAAETETETDTEEVTESVATGTEYDLSNFKIVYSGTQNATLANYLKTIGKGNVDEAFKDMLEDNYWNGWTISNDKSQAWLWNIGKDEFTNNGVTMKWSDLQKMINNSSLSEEKKSALIKKLKSQSNK